MSRTDKSTAQLYQGGFIISDAPIAAPNGWTTWSKSRVFAAFEVDCKVKIVERENDFLIFLGVAVSLDHKTTDQNDLAQSLFFALTESDESFFYALDGFCGRFACICFFNGQLRAFNDACGMRTLYYGVEGSSAIASHAELLAMYFNAKKSIDVAAFLSEAGPREYNMSFLPGFASTYDGIRILCPNNYFDFKNGNIVRFFPSEVISQRSDEDIISTSSKYFEDISVKFSRISPLAISLTSGLDSRLTLAACRSFAEKAIFFTYIRQDEKVNIVDAAIATRIALSNRLAHWLIPFKYELSETDEEFNEFVRFREIAFHCVEAEHFLPLAYAYTKTWPKGYLHLRSNIGEICRARYNQPSFNEVALGETLAVRFGEIYRKWVRCASHPFIAQEIERYIVETRFESNPTGWDPMSLYYWEHLMGVWHGPLLLESDLSHDTVCLFNCRRILKSFMSGSTESQTSARLMRGVIERLMPQLLIEPINPPIAELTETELEAFRVSPFQKMPSRSKQSDR